MVKNTRKNGKKRGRLPLSRERVLETAMRMADKTGITSLSMRVLARALKVEAMSLYNHVGSKSDLVDGIIDLVFGEIALPSSSIPWKPAMRQRASSAREVLTRHRWAVGLMESRSHPGPANLRHHDAVLGNLRASGFSIEMAAHAYALLDAYIYGFVLQQLSLPFDAKSDVAHVAEGMVQAFPPDTYPNLSAMIEHALKPGYDFGNEFEFGLDLILDSLERVLVSSERRAPAS